MKHDLSPTGTQAHEFFQGFQILASSLATCQSEALYSWLKEYPHVLGIALTDTYGIDAFLRDFKLDLATKFQGVRHDSGDPFSWAEKMINHYKKLGIDPLTKVLIFSDGLDIPKAIEIHRKFANQIKIIFGIGTNLTNDFYFKALNIVMKMIRCNSKPVCKLSDEPSKEMCEDAEYLQKVKNTFWIKPVTSLNYQNLGFYKVKAHSPILSIADPDFNSNKMIELIKSSQKEELAISVFPELSLTGYTCEDLFFSNELLLKVQKAIIKILEETKTVSSVIVFGAPYQNQDGRLYNCAFVCLRGKILSVVPKSYLPNYNEFYEKRWFTAGDSVNQHVIDKVLKQSFFLSRKQVFKIDSLILGVEICEDLWAPIPPSSELALAGANVILNLSASNELIAKSEYRKELIKQQSARLNCAYIYSSASVYESSKDLVFSGHLIICENGSILQENEKFSLEDSSICSEIDVEKLMMERRKNTTFGSSPTFDVTVHGLELNYKLSDISRPYTPTPFVPVDGNELTKRAVEIVRIQSMGLARRMIATKAKSLVLGLSGGLDSTLALLVCMEAIEKLKLDRSVIHCLTMPGFGTSDQTKSSAKGLAQALGVSLDEVSIAKAVTQHFKDIGHDPSVINNVYENAQARERTKILFDVANQKEGLVVGTGCLSEAALGWATYNGDHMSSYNVNCSVPKTLVKYLVKHYADVNPGSEISKVLLGILNTVISPELTPIVNKEVQSTESLVGPYILHDFFLFHFLRNGFSLNKIYILAKRTFTGSYSKEEIKKWLQFFYKRFQSQQFKRTTMPAGPKIGSVSLSPRGDWRMPDEVNVEINLEDQE
jgi:NAD+ synthase (glutamine-hydrolysing)